MICTTYNGRIRGTTFKLVLRGRTNRNDQIKMDQGSIVQRPGRVSIAKRQCPIYRRVASQARELTRANERAVTALDRKSVVPFDPELSSQAGVRGFVVCTA